LASCLAHASISVQRQLRSFIPPNAFVFHKWMPGTVALCTLLTEHLQRVALWPPKECWDLNPSTCDCGHIWKGDQVKMSSLEWALIPHGLSNRNPYKEGQTTQDRHAQTAHEARGAEATRHWSRPWPDSPAQPRKELALPAPGTVQQ
jgi:hypothetical protein